MVLQFFPLTVFSSKLLCTSQKYSDRGTSEEWRVILYDKLNVSNESDKLVNYMSWNEKEANHASFIERSTAYDLVKISYFFKLPSNFLYYLFCSYCTQKRKSNSDPDYSNHKNNFNSGASTVSMPEVRWDKYNYVLTQIENCMRNCTFFLFLILNLYNHCD